MEYIDNMISNGIVLTTVVNISKCGRETMKIKSLAIDGVGGIKNLTLNFNNRLNIICGANGVGKTTILESIAGAFSSNRLSNLKKHAGYETGIVNMEYINEANEIVPYSYEILEFEADKQQNRMRTSKYSRSVLCFKADRKLAYISIDGIRRDTIVDDYNAGLRANEGVNSNDVKSWFINRLLFAEQENSLTSEQLSNIKLALNIFSSLDEEMTFSRIKGDTLDILINTLQGEIYLEYLSSGYKSCLYILLGIIKEIELRYKNPYIRIEDFDGVILVDEIDLHLHPEWQAKLVTVLKNMVPRAQIIATTHSPHVVQTALPGEIIPLDLDQNGDVYKRELILGRYGLQGWTIEEILTGIMGLNNTSSDLYHKTIKSFDRAMDEDDVEKIKENYEILNDMLHPNNPIRNILKIQMAGYENDKDNKNI